MGVWGKGEQSGRAVDVEEMCIFVGSEVLPCVVGGFEQLKVVASAHELDVLLEPDFKLEVVLQRCPSVCWSPEVHNWVVHLPF